MPRVACQAAVSDPLPGQLRNTFRQPMDRPMCAARAGGAALSQVKENRTGSDVDRAVCDGVRKDHRDSTTGSRAISFRCELER